MRRYGYKYKSRFHNEREQEPRIIRILNLLVLIFSLLVLILLTFAVIKVVRENLIQKTVISPVQQGIVSSIEGVRQMLFPVKLDQVVQKSLKGADGEYAVAIKNLKTGESYYYHADEEFQSASLYKLWVLAASFRKIDNKTLDPNKFLTDDVVNLNQRFEIATESAELTEGTISARVIDALEQMIVISNNYAALLLVSEIKLSTVAQFLTDFGFSHSETGSPPRTTARDIADFYEKLYLGKLASKESGKKMLDLLKDQTLNDRIPKYLPEKLDVAHKTGELDGFKHDAGIVYTPFGDYILVILSNTQSQEIAAEREAVLSKDIYTYFSAKK